MAIWVTCAVAQGKAEAVIPDYALDMHTAAGQALGRVRREHFFPYPASQDLPRNCRAAI